MAKTPQTPCDVRSRLVNICEQVSCGDYEKAKTIFELPMAPEGGDTQTQVLVEAFAMMLVNIEAREFERERLLTEISAAREELKIHQARLANENRRLRAQVRKQSGQTHIIAQDARMQALLRQAERCAMSQTNLLLTGETGTGKGLLARHIHAMSSRADKPFVAINCAAIPSSLLESELFGIESGVASGVNARIGRFEQTAGGTLLLDEIGDMPLESQTKILDVIESGVVERVGGRKSIPIDVRIMAATHRNLGQLVEQKLFRADLYYRLNVVHLSVPPLRERRDDIPLLARAILAGLCVQIHSSARQISSGALHLLTRHAWPGNIRELQNVLEQAVLLSDGTHITPEDLPPALHDPERDMVPVETPPGTVSQNSREKASTLKMTEQTNVNDGSQSSINTLEEAETAHILRALRLAGGNKSHTARILGISREGLRVKLSRMRLFEK